MNDDIPLWGRFAKTGTVFRGTRARSGRHIGFVRDGTGQDWPASRVDRWPRRSYATVVVGTHTYVTAVWPRRITDEQLRGLLTRLMHADGTDPLTSRLDR